jgi:hypothetical protein
LAEDLRGWLEGFRDAIKDGNAREARRMITDAQKAYFRT